MSKINRYIQNYLIYGFIFVAALLIWGSCEITHPVTQDTNNIVIKILHELLSLNFMLWFLTLIVFMGLLVVAPSVRDKTLRRLANLQERDEREEYITGKAARASYITTLALSLFFLFFSLVSVNISKLHKTTPQSYGHSAGISFHYSFFKESEVKAGSDEQTVTIFDSNNYSVSNATLILILLCWQLSVFNIAARRE